MDLKDQIKEIEDHITYIEEGDSKKVLTKIHKTLEELHKSMEKLEETLSQKDGD